MNIVFRVDAHRWMGVGHLMRCLTLAEQLAAFGSDIHFICRPGQHNFYDRVTSAGYFLHFLPTLSYMPVDTAPADERQWLIAQVAQDAQQTLSVLTLIASVDWLIVDHYGVDVDWENYVSVGCDLLAVIEDIPRREHACDLLVDQTLGRRAEEYLQQLNQSCRLLLGTQYSMLRPAFRLARERIDERPKIIKRVNVLLALGGGQGDQVALECLEVLMLSELASSQRHYRIDIISGDTQLFDDFGLDNENIDVVNHDYVDNIEELLLAADIAIGAPGGATWERCCLGVPSVLIPFADNQKMVAASIADRNCGLVVERELITKKLVLAVAKLLENNQIFRQQSLKSIDALGAARLTQYFFPELSRDKKPVTLRLATTEDIERVYEWQQLPEVRRFARNPNAPSWQEHQVWMQARLDDPSCIFHLLYHDEDAAGVIRLDQLSAGHYELSIYLVPKKFRLGLGLAGLRLIDRIAPHITVHATVLADNLASNNLFRRAGYRYGTSEKYIRSPIIGTMYD